VKAIEIKETFLEQEEGLLITFEAMRMMIQLYEIEWNFEYDYLKKNHGFFE